MHVFLILPPSKRSTARHIPSVANFKKTRIRRPGQQPKQVHLPNTSMLLANPDTIQQGRPSQGGTPQNRRGRRRSRIFTDVAKLNARNKSNESTLFKGRGKRPTHSKSTDAWETTHCWGKSLTLQKTQISKQAAYQATKKNDAESTAKSDRNNFKDTNARQTYAKKS